MSALKTREAAERLGVSPTTVKRWAAQFSPSFRKDSVGHYVFSPREFELLRYIKDRTEQGSTLEQITLPGLPVSSEDPREENASSPGKRELLLRISEIERSLEQKADEVVSVQVRQHRAELDELLRVVTHLTSTVEALQERAAAMANTARIEALRAPTTDNGGFPERKRKAFRTFF
ncbi:MerR family transcriptional regulator [Cohnella boryungensis]|uniref:MerR family transcriptional regulator n=1 Tax=Cohnella boryungensis TaxID=768479 RepID=A0ABV8S9P1_9BACL